MPDFADDADVMQHALTIARLGIGAVEPNPAVGAVIVDQNGRLVGEGFHRQFGSAHAEIQAIAAAGSQCRGADLFVTLEPCSHFGKTPPCADAVIAAGFRRVIVGCEDPALHVAGRGLARLRDAGLEVVVGVCADAATRLIAPFQMLMCGNRPWVHAKWAMSVDGRIAATTGHSKWISCDHSRARVHLLRGRMDAVITGAGTVRADDPLLTARPPGPRIPIRVVLDSTGTSLTAESNLVRTAWEIPVLVFVSSQAEHMVVDRLLDWGIQVVPCPPLPRAPQATTDLGPGSAVNRISPQFVLQELGRRKCTNVLLEAGGRVQGSFFDAGLVDEVHVFVAPKVLGGTESAAPVGGLGLSVVPALPNLSRVRWRQSGQDLMLQADVVRDSADESTI